jgi:rhomboid protease GluP
VVHVFLVVIRHRVNQRERGSLATLAIVAINVGLFATMWLTGVDVTAPTNDQLIHWGANSGPNTVDGEWWRLLTNLFLHVGLLHLFSNLAMLWIVGRRLERLLGKGSFLTVYVLSGLAGSLASISSNPLAISVGASGAVFGACGALLSVVLCGGESKLDKVAQKGIRLILVCLAADLLFGCFVRGIDVAAHVGGLAIGFLCGFALQATSERSFAGFGRTVLVASIGLLMLVSSAFALPRSPTSVQRELAYVAKTERRVRVAHDQAVARLNAGKMTQGEWADFIDRELLPPWRDARTRLTACKVIPFPHAQLVETFDKYMHARQKSWQLMVEGIRLNDVNRLRQSRTQAELSNRLAARL